MSIRRQVTSTLIRVTSTGSEVVCAFLRDEEFDDVAGRVPQSFDGAVVPCIVDVFQVEVEAVNDLYKELGQRVIAWVTPVEAARRVREIELKSLLIDFTLRVPEETAFGRRISLLQAASRDA